jgi:hypothetical protein
LGTDPFVQLDQLIGEALESVKFIHFPFGLLEGSRVEE